MPIYDFKCRKCKNDFEEITTPLQAELGIKCKCGGDCDKIAGRGNIKAYAIKGDNSASVTPKKRK